MARRVLRAGERELALEVIADWLSEDELPISTTERAEATSLATVSTTHRGSWARSTFAPRHSCRSRHDRGLSGQSVQVGVVAILREERGDQVRCLPDPAGGTFDAAGDFDHLIPFEDRSFRLLCYVNPYGNTVFNTVQMADLLTDLERLVGRASKPIERRGFDRFRVLAERCRDEPHLYLWFFGV